ncbi:MAG: decaprenyl-phosphate phosphoribosyltransferase [Actinomycetota bacterium]|nr:decaprenyl-phosphate phosphoribosyltransferase [Actinomycetota bacterium]
MSGNADNPALDVFPHDADASPEQGEAGRLEVVELAPPLRLRGLFSTARPRQWVKNLLVFAAPGTAGLLTDPSAVAVAAGTFGVFCLAASGTYFLNDALNVDADRLHPTKRRRPVATGAVGVGLAEVLGGSLLIISVALSLVLAGWKLALVVAVYVILQPIYSIWLRNVPIVDLVVVASGFVLRAIAGGIAVAVPISHWFLLVTSFGSLFLVSGKRSAEHIDLGDRRARHRATLGEYSLGFLHWVRSVTASVAVAAYCLWAFERGEVAPYAILFQLSIIPFVLLTLRYAQLLDAGRGGCPEELVFEDRALQLFGLLWVTSVGVGIHGG